MMMKYSRNLTFGRAYIEIIKIKSQIKLIAFCTSMIPFSMIDNVDTTLTPYARKFPALHSKEIFYDDEKRRYSIGDRTRRDVDVRYHGLHTRDLRLVMYCALSSEFSLYILGFKSPPHNRNVPNRFLYS
jgi:hypothetical protein